MKKQTHQFWIAGLVFLCFLAKTALTQAQITSDATLSTQVKATNNLDFTITNGNRLGSNLFHSFREFSVPTGGSASFTNDLDVQNIISRVTGASISNIDGSLKTNGSANLFLINPNGIIFGPNASLNINGSFVASTASHLLFADGTQFSANNPQTPPLLTVSLPIGLQFGQTAEPLQIEGSTLQVPLGQTLALLGGDVFIDGGRLIAPEGRIELGSVAGNSLVSLTPISEGWALGYEGVQNFQDIQVSQAADIDTTGEGHGAIQLRGREIAIANYSIVGGETLGEKPGQPLAIEASESVEVSDSSQLITFTKGNGAASDITIATRRLIVREGGLIEASTFSSGSGGNLTVDASESVEVLGGSRLFSSLNVRSLSTDKDAGNAGTVQISTGKLILRDGGQISTSTIGAGNGGNLTVDASESVEASGRIVVNTVNFPSGLLAETRKAGFIAATGMGGDLIINTQRLVVQDGASISVAAINGSTGQAGRLDINASDSVTVTGTGIDRNSQVVPSTLLAASEGSGSAGDLSINTGTLTVRDRAAVSVSNQGAGNAGNLEITAGELLLDNEGKLTAETTAGQGNINLRSGDLILRRGSQITTNATDRATGGNITINTDNLVAIPKEDSNISANAEDSFGGRVIVNASGIFGTQFRERPTPLSDITASSQLGPQFNGTVQLNTPDIDPNQGLAALPTNVIDPSELIANSCIGRSNRREGKFIITGNGGLPLAPDDPPVAPYQTYQIPTVESASVSRSGEREGDSEASRERSADRSLTTNSLNSTPPTAKPLVEASGWKYGAHGEVILTAQAATVAPDSSLSKPPTCQN
jgi:filamentous hemagglutinin family protein